MTTSPNETSAIVPASVVRVPSVMPAYQLAEMRARRDALVIFIKEQMTRDLDYGIIPGSSKPTLLKPGAERLVTFFGLVPEFVEVRAVEDFATPLFFYRYKCVLKRDDKPVGEGIGSCNSHEKKYRYRYANRTCPICRKPTIRDAGADWDCVYYCHKKSGGCGARFGGDAENDDREIAAQPAGLVENPDPADALNTLDKIAQKRALIAAVLITVNASEFFTQDLDDLLPEGPAPTPTKPQGDGDAQGPSPAADDQRPEGEQAQAAAKRGRGRPAGSKNKAPSAHNGKPDGPAVAAQGPAPAPATGNAAMGGRNYLDNKTFVAEVKRLAHERLGFDESAALGILGETARKHGKASLNDCDNDWRNSFIASIEGGLWDHRKNQPPTEAPLPNGNGDAKPAAAADTSTLPPNVEGSSPEARPETATTGEAAAPAASTAPTTEPGPAPGVGEGIDVTSWEKFLDLWNDGAIANGWTPAEAATVLSKRLHRVGKAANPRDTQQSWRRETILALRAQRIYKGSGALMGGEGDTLVEAQATGTPPSAGPLPPVEAKPEPAQPTKVTARRRKAAPVT